MSEVEVAVELNGKVGSLLGNFGFVVRYPHTAANIRDAEAVLRWSR